MLAELKIENVAVIEKAEVQFAPGLNVLTGETGAGKSIMIDSINAILGNRASRDLVRSGAPKARIWATFESIPAHVREQVENAAMVPRMTCCCTARSARTEKAAAVLTVCPLPPAWCGIFPPGC